MIDLHVHTSMSDGTFSPERLVRLAADKGLQAIAITDHDTVAGIGPARTEGAILGVEVVAGVEISTQWPSGILHILGYFVDPENHALLVTLEHLRGGRLERIPKIIDKLRRCNVPISADEVHREAVGGVPGRPHVAEIMVQRGYVRTIQEAFDRYLKKGAPAYVEKVKLPPGEAVDLIVEAGGLAVLAHPYSLNQTEPLFLEQILRGLIAGGLKGIEAYYPKHTIEQTRAFLRLASELDLAITGGTDFHGSNKPEIQLGVVPGVVGIPYSILTKLKQRKESVSPVDGWSQTHGFQPEVQDVSTDPHDPGGTNP
ncbi:MAG: PHP domain-containing protein [Deltaproteobacteria bacterium]|nr:PHP domain-containing protein [Deltaproteobacteria bacterium]